MDLIMRFLHTADLHLDAVMASKLPPEKARERRGELLNAFSNIANTAKELGASAVIIAGDLFDKANVSRRAMKYVLETVRNTADVDFLILEGNHDGDAFAIEDIPSNLKLFSDKNKEFAYGDVIISAYGEGAEFDASHVNIAVLHGGDGSDFDVSKLAGKGIDYLALGHYHSYSSGKLDARGVWCYPGCPEGRGFDECGEKGFVVLDVDGGVVSHKFVSSAKRKVLEIEVDMSEGVSFSDQEKIMSDALAAVDRKNIVRVNVVGGFEAGREKYYDHIAEKYKDEFFYFELRDRSVLDISPDDYINDISLKGEFIRLVMNSVEDEVERGRIISIGIKALMGDKIE